MKDLGLNTFRKSNAFEEWFVRYKPSDYRTILDEYRSMHLQSKEEPMNRHTRGPEYAAENGNAHAVGKKVRENHSKLQ